jgi:hypothetical protein
VTAAPDLPTVETLDAITKRLGSVYEDVQAVVYEVEEFLGYTDGEGHVVTLPTLGQIGALHSFRELIEMDVDQITENLAELAEKLIDLNPTRLDANGPVTPARSLCARSVRSTGWPRTRRCSG